MTDTINTSKPEESGAEMRALLAPMVAEGASDKEMAEALNLAGYRRNGREWCFKTVGMPLVLLGLRERNLDRFSDVPSFGD